MQAKMKQWEWSRTVMRMTESLI